MAYLYFGWDTHVVEQIVERNYEKCEVAEKRLARLDQLAKRFGLSARDRLYIKQEQQRQSADHARCLNLAEMAQAELEWREDPSRIIAEFAEDGHALRFYGGNGEYETEAEAVADARHQCIVAKTWHYFGPDGAGCNDMYSPERSVQAVFVYQERSID